MITVEEATLKNESTAQPELTSDTELARRYILQGEAEDDARCELFRTVVDEINDICFTEAPIEVVITHKTIAIRRLPSDPLLVSTPEEP
jgi:hypothetical protein